MESLKCLKNYIERFHCFNFDDFLNMYNRLYPDYDNLKNKIEFSILINQYHKFNLRFGLFKLYDRQAVASLLKNSRYKILNLEEIISFAKEFVPEIALGFDFDRSDPRIKVYFLRLPDNPKFNNNPIDKINTFFRINNFELPQRDNEELKKCYIMGIDFHRTGDQDIKIYMRNETADFVITKNYLTNNGINPQYLEYFSMLFSNGILRDTTVSKKYSSNHASSTGLSIFFEVADNSNQIIEKLINNCVPERINAFKETINVLEKDKPVAYSHVGLTFSGNKENESICVYFSPVCGG